MTQQDKEQLKLEIGHIFESGANEIRIFGMVVNFIDSRKCWIKADDSRPEYDGRYLAHIVTKEECGNFTKRLEVVYFGYAKWYIKENERLTHWMIILPPDRTVTLL